MQKKLYILVTLLLLQCSPFGGWGAFAQTYPVTISTQLTQPSPIYLSNYANTTSINSPIKVQLILNDLTIMNRQVRLKCYFQGAVSFVSNDFVVGATPIYLEGGFPTQLTNVELGPYFEYQNLQGVNPNQYAQPLPEGIYILSFEVYDFATNKKLSKKSSVTTIIFQNEPPFLNLPVNKAEIVEQNIQNIIFSWTPRSINVSNVEYEFSLVEIWNTNTPLQNAFAYSPPLYTTTTRNTTVQYSIAEPQLIPGKTYAWRVKAKALVGAEEIGVFKNNGYSEIFSFKYLTFCKAPLAITTTDVSQDQAKVTWSGEVDNYDYQVNYREKNADSKWYKLVTPREYITISNLKPKTTYEYTVGAACDPGEYTHSNIQEFTTLAQDEIAFVGCGIKPDPAALSNKTPLPALFPNDVVTAGDFPIVVLKSTGSNGTFSGEGYVTLPFLEKFKELIDAADALGGDKVNIGKYSRIRITFNNIGINTDFKLISGEIVASYDKNWGGMVDGDKLVNDIMGDTGTVIPIDVQFEIKSVVKNPDGSLTITGPNKIVVQLPKNENDVIITDRNGNQYAVSPNAPAGEIKSIGKAAPGGVPTAQNTNGMGSGGNIKEISSPDVSITFAAGTGFYSLDENPNQDPKLKANTKLNNTYDIIPKKDGTSYYVHYKVISDAPKAEDYVTAKATFSNGKSTADIVFKTENGTEIKPVWSGNVATLALKRTLDFAKESILATVKPTENKANTTPPSGAGGPKYDIAGALNMWHVTGKKVNITLVGLNGGETPTQSQAQEYLNSIYGKAGIQFEVSTTKATITDSWGTSIETGDSDLLNTYTDGQQTITNDFQTQLGSSYKNDTYYVLFTKVPSSKSGILGFMPLKRQFGFIFAPPSGAGGLRTLAHELGHGIFGLQHPFTEYNTTVTTDLLMDYGTGTALNHNDWEIMHAPGLQLYQFIQGSSAGELLSGIWYAPDWKPFIGKKEYIPVIEASSSKRPEGTIRKIFIKSTNIYYEYDPDKRDYVSLDKIPLLINPVLATDLTKNKAYLYKYEGGCGKDACYETTNVVVESNKSSIANLFAKSKPLYIFACITEPKYEDLKIVGKDIYALNKSLVPKKDLGILMKIASLGDVIGKDNYNSFVSKLRNDGNLFWQNTNQQVTYSTENLNNTLEALNKFSNAITKLKNFDYQDVNELITDIDENFKITKGSNNIFVFPSDMRWTQLLNTPFSDLTAERSIKIIDLIDKATFNTAHVVGDPICAEQILDVILDQYAKGNNLDNKKKIIDHIRDQKYLFHFVNGINGIYYESFINSMIIMTHQVYKAPAFKINPDRFLAFNPAFLQLNSESISDDGKVQLKIKQWFSDNKYDISANPYEYITISFVDDIDFGGNFQFKKNQKVQMSAICAYQLFHKDTRAAQWKSAKITGEVVLTAVGIGEITAAIRLYRTGQTVYATYLGVKALGDVGFGFLDIYINNSDNSLTDSQKERWNKFFMIYSIASISATGIEVATNKIISKLNKGGNSYSEFENAIEESNIDIDQLYKDNVENPTKIPGSFADQIDLISKQLPANLQKQFNDDFANANEQLIKALQKEDSELIKGWTKYRKKNPLTILCNQ